MFKNVEGKGRARKENNIKGKKWYSNRFHRLRSVDSGQHGLLLPTTAFVSALTHQCQSGLHFISRMHIARFLRHQDSLGQKFAGLLYFSDSRKMLAKLEIPGDVTWIRFQEFLEVLGRRIVIPCFGALQREPVASERIGWFLRNKLFENFAACLLGWRHRVMSSL